MTRWSRVSRLKKTCTFYVWTSHNTAILYVMNGKLEQSSQTSEYSLTLCQDRQCGAEQQNCTIPAHLIVGLARRRRIARLKNTAIRLQNNCSYCVRTSRVDQNSKTSEYWNTLCQDWQGGAEQQDCRGLAHTASGCARWSACSQLQNTGTHYVRTGRVEQSSKTPEYLVILFQGQLGLSILARRYNTDKHYGRTFQVEQSSKTSEYFIMCEDSMHRAE